MSWTAETHGSGEPGSGKRQTQQPKPFDINPSNSGPKLIWTALLVAGTFSVYATKGGFLVISSMRNPG